MVTAHPQLGLQSIAGCLTSPIVACLTKIGELQNGIYGNYGVNLEKRHLSRAENPQIIAPFGCRLHPPNHPLRHSFSRALIDLNHHG